MRFDDVIDTVRYLSIGFEKKSLANCMLAIGCSAAHVHTDFVESG